MTLARAEHSRHPRPSQRPQRAPHPPRSICTPRTRNCPTQSHSVAQSHTAGATRAMKVRKTNPHHRAALLISLRLHNPTCRHQSPQKTPAKTPCTFPPHAVVSKLVWGRHLLASPVRGLLSTSQPPASALIPRAGVSVAAALLNPRRVSCSLSFFGVVP